MSKWIPFDKYDEATFPPDWDEYIVTDGDRAEVARYDRRWHDAFGCRIRFDVTHYMKRPKLPKEGER
jgi:hypothetical protein